MALIQCCECGHTVSDRAECCPQCGCPIRPAQAEPPSSDGDAVNAPADVPKKGSRSKRLLIVVGLAVCLVGLLVTYACFFADGGGAFSSGSAKAEEPVVVITDKFAKKIRKYDKLGTFHEGLALVQRNGLFGYIDTAGTEVIACMYQGTPREGHGFNFSEGLAVVIDREGRFGYINTEGKMVIRPQFDDAANFSEGVAAVWRDERMNFIGRDGKFIPELSNKFTWDYDRSRYLPQFKNGACEVYLPARQGHAAEAVYVNKQGNKTVQPPQQSPKPAYVVYSKGDKVGYKDSVGNIIVEAKYHEISDISCGVAVAVLEYGEEEDGLGAGDHVAIYGYVDLHGHDTFVPADYATLDQAKLKAERRKQQQAEQRQQAEQQQQADNAKQWLQGNWKAQTSYGEVRVGISGDIITVFNSGRLRYAGRYDIEGDELNYDRRPGSSFVLYLDHAGQRLMVDPDTPMQRFAGSGGASSSSGGGSVTFRTDSQVMSYLTSRTFYSSRASITFYWDGISINGQRRMSGAPRVLRFSEDRAVVKISMIPGGDDFYVTVFPREGRIVDEGGVSYYAR